MTLQRISMPSPSFSSRSGSTVRLIVIHTAEGARTIQSLGSWFANPANQVSSHTGIDDTPNTVGEYVSRSMNAWTAANANPVAIQTELCAFAAWDLPTWNQHPAMLETCAQWIAEEATHFGIPLVQLSPQQAQTNGRGVCRHMDLGTWGGNHSDPGPSFPIASVIQRAIQITSGVTPEEPDMTPAGCTFTMNENQQQYFAVDSNGNMIHWWFLPGKPWAKENLGGGWDKDSQLIAYEYVTNWQVWGVRANGGRAQLYWSGTKWVYQPLP